MPAQEAVKKWVDEVAAWTRPDRVVWCDGSEEENARLTRQMLDDGTLIELDQQRYPGCTLHRSNPSDVARSEHLTFICTSRKEDAGPTNNWMSPKDAREKVWTLFKGSMKGRTLYVVPYLMGPVGSPFSRVGVEITDSPYVVVNMRIMTRMGTVALDHLKKQKTFVKGLHSLGDLDPQRRFICHFPETGEIWSVGSGYGGNALLSKKCHALRLASWTGREEGWLAEHMLILGLEDPQGNVTYVAAAFPSACGKTNLAMLVPPAAFKGYKIWTVGDDIAWLHPGEDGRLWAVNPEAGFFGVAPGTGNKTNPNAMASTRKNTIFTNVAMTPDRLPWWEGMDGEAPKQATDWQGKPWTPASGRPAAHPNSRFTAPARQCPGVSPEFDSPRGVPISAIIFGGRRAQVAPLVYQAFDWRHGVFVGATMASETTAAATGQVGVVRRDPMAMLPFCGYNMADYFGHWLKTGEALKRPPAVFHVNWFRKSPEGKFLWPGYGENLRVLLWMMDRVNGKGKAQESPIGWVPSAGALNLDGLGLTPAAAEALLAVDPEAWQAELKGQDEFLGKFGDRLPKEIRDEHRKLGQRIARTAASAVK